MPWVMPGLNKIWYKLLTLKTFALIIYFFPLNFLIGCSNIFLFLNFAAKKKSDAVFEITMSFYVYILSNYYIYKLSNYIYIYI